VLRNEAHSRFLQKQKLGPSVARFFYIFRETHNRFLQTLTKVAGALAECAARRSPKHSQSNQTNQSSRHKHVSLAGEDGHSDSQQLLHAWTD
jgi:hypothetical protein